MRFKNNRLWLLFLPCMGLISCKVYKDHSTPAIDMPLEYRNSVGVIGDSLQLEYNTFFKDELLSKYIKTALVQNQDIQVALKTIDQLDLTYKQAKKNMLPTLDLNINANRNWVSKNSLNGSLTEQFTGNKYLDDYNATLKVSWEVDIWGKTKLLKESTKHAYLSQQDQMQALRTRIVVQVAQAYYHLIALDEQRKIAEENVALSNEALRMLNLQYNAGKINVLAIKEEEAQKKVAELILPQARKQIEVQENALSILLGVYPQQIQRSSHLESLLYENELSVSIPAKLLSRRPNLRAAEHQVYSLRAKTGLANIAMYPAISLTPNIGANSFMFNNWFDLPGSLIKTVAANLAMPLLNKRQLNTQYKIALLEQEKAAIEFRRATLNAVAEVSDAMAKSSTASEKILLIKDRSSALNESVDASAKLYTMGKISYLEVLTAKNNRLDNQLEYIQSVLEKLQAEVELYRALGGTI